MKILDVCCGVGGVSRGLQWALPGAHITGIDIEPQPEYIGNSFIQGDGIEYIYDCGKSYDFIWMSWPCQFSSALTKGTNFGRSYPDLIPPGRLAALGTGVPWIIENVAGADIRHDLMLCGEMYGLSTLRHRYFEYSPSLQAPYTPHPPHRGPVRGYRHGIYRDGPYLAVHGAGGGKATDTECRTALGIDWTWNRHSLVEAIPPAYTYYIGQHLEPQLRKT